MYFNYVFLYERVVNYYLISNSLNCDDQDFMPALASKALIRLSCSFNAFTSM